MTNALLIALLCLGVIACGVGIVAPRVAAVCGGIAIACGAVVFLAVLLR